MEISGQNLVKCVVIGGGPAGYTASIYARRAALEPILFEGMQRGGQLTTTTHIANYPGFADGVEASDLMAAMRAQAVNLGVDVRDGVVTAVQPEEGEGRELSNGAQSSGSVPRSFLLTLESGEQIRALSLIIATGASAKYLGLPSEEKFKGMGVSACATCDGFFYRRKTVAVVGGGDTACEEASYLSGLCKKVYMIVRRNVLRASDAMQKRVLGAGNIEILWECSTVEVLGDDNGVNGVRLRRGDGSMFDIDVDGFFLAIGHHPNSDIFAGLLDVDSEGYIVTQGKSTRTSVPGIFAAGDVQDPSYRQAITAAASGAAAAMDAKRYLESL